VLGIGNPLAGDDGAGPEVVRRLGETWGTHPEVILSQLEGDIFGLADWVGAAERLVLVDATVGEPPGRVVRSTACATGLAPSLHHVDVTAVMRSLETIRMADPFPAWELWGITVSLPLTLGEGLSRPVHAAVRQLADLLSERLQGWL